MRGCIGSSSMRATPRREATRRWKARVSASIPLSDVDPDPATPSPIVNSSRMPSAGCHRNSGRSRPPSPPGVPAHRDRGDPRVARRDRAVPPSLRGPSAADRARRGHASAAAIEERLRMNRSDEPLFDPQIADWLEDDPYEAPQQALERRARRLPFDHAAGRGAVAVVFFDILHHPPPWRRRPSPSSWAESSSWDHGERRPMWRLRRRPPRGGASRRRHELANRAARDRPPWHLRVPARMRPRRRLEGINAAGWVLPRPADDGPQARRGSNALARQGGLRADGPGRQAMPISGSSTRTAPNEIPELVGFEDWPARSPDGTRLLFTRTSLQDTVETSEIAIRTVAPAARLQPPESDRSCSNRRVSRAPRRYLCRRGRRMDRGSRSSRTRTAPGSYTRSTSTAPT